MTSQNVGFGAFRVRRFWLLGCLPLVSCNSTDRQSESAWLGSTRDSAGVEIVDNPASGIWADVGGWRLEEDLRIGSVESDPDYEFGDIVGVAPTGAGNIAVLDLEADQPLRVYDSDGRFISATGGFGSGPGEFASGAGPLFIAGDSLLVAPDYGNSRVNIFNASGQFRNSIPVTLTELVNRWGATSEGVPVLQVGLSMMAGMEETDDFVDVLLAIGTDGTERDTLLTFPSGQRFLFEGGMPELTFFAPEPFWVIAPNDAIYLGINYEYAIGIYERGALRRMISREYSPVAVGDRDREIVLDAWIRVFSERIPNADATLRQLARFHDVFPAYQQFLVSPEGTLWVQRTQMPSELSEQESASFDPTGGWGARQWDVFDSDGRYLGEVELPNRFEMMALRTDYALGVWRDDLDVQYVKRLRILR